MNSERVILSRDKDKMFLPMNVDGNRYDDNFFNTTKILTIVSLLISWIVIIVWLNSLVSASYIFKFMCILMLLVITFYSIRYIIFEEKYFYKMYKKTLLYFNPTSDVFWNISNIKDSDMGSIILFSDGRLGLIVKLKRGSIIGKDKDFIEEHYDAVSDFLREIVNRDYKYVNLNMMERADNDDRLDAIGIKLNTVENKNIRKLLELELGYLKNITRNSLYETDYYLLYTDKLDKMDSLIRDTEDILEILLNGSFSGYEILNRREVIALHKELIGISYFDYNKASINTFREFQVSNKSALTIKKLYLSNGSVIELDNLDENILRSVITDIENSSELKVNVLDRFNLKKYRNNRLRTGLNLDKSVNNQRNIINKTDNITEDNQDDLDHTDEDSLSDDNFDDFDEQLSYSDSSNEQMDYTDSSDEEVSDDFILDI